MALTSSNCRVCGIRVSAEDADTHELTCLQESQDRKDLAKEADDEGNESGTSQDTSSEYDNSSADERNEASEDSAYPPFPWEEVNPGTEGEKDPCDDHGVTSTPQSMRYDRKKPDNLFPPTKKYRYYPVTCDYCLKRFQPNKLKAHQEKHHSRVFEDKKTQRAQSAATRRVASQEPPPKARSKSVGGMPKRLQICYVCGRMYGSKSLKIHEPKCLEKWRIQNDQLPPELRAPEPVKEEAISPVAEDRRYTLPEFDPTAEAAYRSHLKTLIPCTHCSRTFSPDRIQKHISCCIERPKTREYAKPPDGEIKR